MSGDSSTSEITAPYAYAAQTYWRNGWPNPIPVRGKRHPAAGYTGHNGVNVNYPDMTAWIQGPEAGHNIALRMAGTVGIDVDAYDGEVGNISLKKAIEALGDLPPTYTSTSRGQGQPSRIYLFRIPFKREPMLARREKAFADTFGPNVEILHRAHRYAVVWPSIHPDTGERYEWFDPDGRPCEPPLRAAIPELPPTWLDFLAPETNTPLPAPAAPASDDPFGTPDQLFTSRVGAGPKSPSAALRDMGAELEKFAAPNADGRSTSILPGVAMLAGRGIQAGIWTEEKARESIAAVARANGYIQKHGMADFQTQLDNGIRDGKADPWTIVPDRDTPAALQPLPDAKPDDVDALVSELLTARQIIERPAPKYLVRGLLNLDSESWLIGAAGSKKSFVALDMAAHVAHGREWQGLKTRQARVIIVAAEGAGGLGLRLAAWEKTYGQISEDVLVLPRPVQSGDREKWAVLVQACKRLTPGLVILDTQARVTVGLEENSAKEMGIYVEAVRAIREVTGACVLTVHHTGRSGSDARGSSALDGAQHTELTVESKGPLAGLLKVTKQKDMEAREDLKLAFQRIDLGVNEEGDPIDSLVLANDPIYAISQLPPEIEPWEAGHGAVMVQLFKVLRDQGGTSGLTKAEARLAVIERFHGGDPKRLHKATWYTAWSRGREKFAASRDPVMVNPEGEKWTVDPEALAGMPVIS